MPIQVRSADFGAHSVHNLFLYESLPCKSRWSYHVNFTNSNKTKEMNKKNGPASRVTALSPFKRGLDEITRDL